MATFENYVSNTVVSGTDVADEMYNQFNGVGTTATNVTLQGYGGNDTIFNYCSYSLMDGGSGDDDLYNAGGSYVTINGGDGNDDIENITISYSNYKNSEGKTVDFETYPTLVADNNYIDAGNGNDTIKNSCSNVTIKGGMGDDSVFGHGTEFFQYNLGDGNDSIWYFNSADTLNITGASYSSATVDNNIVITVGEGTDSVGTITLIDAAGTQLNINGDGGTTETTPGGITTTISENTNATDYVFIFDTSGSMDTYITRVKDIAADFTKQLTSQGVDYRLGIVEYESTSNIQTYDFTSDINTFTADVATVAEKARYGGGSEYGLTAVDTALAMDYREGVSKHFVVLTDAGYQESNSESETTIANLNADSVKVDVIGMPYEKGTWSDEYACQPEWEPIATVTGGAFYDINGDYNSIFTSISGGSSEPYMQLSRWSYNFTFPTSDDSSNMILASAT